jgi:hypothetical protein
MTYKIYGALGFGLGGFVSGLIWNDRIGLSLFLMGAIGSAILSLPARSLKLTIFSSIMGGSGFFVGIFPGIAVTLFFEATWVSLIVGLFIGLIAGTFLGIVYGDIRAFVLLGTFGFGISFGLSILLWEVLPSLSPTFIPGTVNMIGGGIGGVFFGKAALSTKNRWTFEKR